MSDEYLIPAKFPDVDEVFDAADGAPIHLIMQQNAADNAKLKAYMEARDAEEVLTRPRCSATINEASVVLANGERLGIFGGPPRSFRCVLPDAHDGWHLARDENDVAAPFPDEARSDVPAVGDTETAV